MSRPTYEIFPLLTERGVRYCVKQRAGFLRSEKRLMIKESGRFFFSADDWDHVFHYRVTFLTVKKAIKALRELKGTDAVIILWSAK